MTQVFITKYARTEGIVACERVSFDGYFTGVKWPIGNSLYFVATFNAMDAYLCFPDAIARAEKMRDSKITSLRKQLAKLEALTFEVKPWPLAWMLSTRPN